MNRLSKPSLESAHDPLGAYKSKRDFALTPEPAEGGQHLAEPLTLVVQKHWASSLHYDFRLELLAMPWTRAVGSAAGLHAGLQHGG